MEGGILPPSGPPPIQSTVKVCAYDDAKCRVDVTKLAKLCAILDLQIHPETSLTQFVLLSVQLKNTISQRVFEDFFYDYYIFMNSNLTPYT